MFLLEIPWLVMEYVVWGMLWEPPFSSMFRPTCYRQIDRTDRETMSWCSSHNEFDLCVLPITFRWCCKQKHVPFVLCTDLIPFEWLVFVYYLFMESDFVWTLLSLRLPLAPFGGARGTRNLPLGTRNLPQETRNLLLGTRNLVVQQLLLGTSLPQVPGVRMTWVSQTPSKEMLPDADMGRFA